MAPNCQYCGQPPNARKRIQELERQLEDEIGMRDVIAHEVVELRQQVDRLKRSLTAKDILIDSQVQFRDRQDEKIQRLRQEASKLRSVGLEALDRLRMSEIALYQTRCALIWCDERIQELEECLREAIILMEDVRTGNYKPDTLTTQPWRQALKGEK